MSKKHKRSPRADPPVKRETAGSNAAMQAFLMSCGCFDSLGVSGYSSLINSPDVAAAVDVIAEVVSSATIHLLQNTEGGDQRVKDGLSRFVDIHPYSMGTRKTLVNWIVTYMLTYGDGNAFVLPVTRDGQLYLEDLVPMPGAEAVSLDGGLRYEVHWNGRVFQPNEVLHFVQRPDVLTPWKGRGIRLQLKDVLQNLKQSAATTNSFLSDKWKPSVIVKVDALADEFSSPEGRKKLMEQYIENQNAGEPWLIPADLMDVVTVKPLSLSDLALNENVQLDKRAVAAAIGVPAFTIGVGSFSQDEYNNFIRRKVVPLADGIAQELTRKLLISPGLFFRFNARKLYAYNYEQLAKVGGDMYVRGMMTGNEVRDWLDLAPKEGLDELVMLENYIPVDQAGNQKKLIQEGKSNGE